MTSMMWVVAAIGVQGVSSLLALRMRLRWQVLREQERRHCLVAIARALPEGSQIDEGQPDGTWLKLTIDHPQHSEGNDG